MLEKAKPVLFTLAILVGGLALIHAVAPAGVKSKLGLS